MGGELLTVRIRQAVAVLAMSAKQDPSPRLQLPKQRRLPQDFSPVRPLRLSLPPSPSFGPLSSLEGAVHVMRRLGPDVFQDFFKTLQVL
eukprot:scaffold837_cov255-Pinguiococcus_pyrenoidosus.AAC.7